jgi:hypothetical protein
MAYWEAGIQPVNMPDHLSSFHPKVWVIKYDSKETLPKYRVLVTSRNLTFSRDWDMAFSTDGIVTDKEQPANKPLVHFLTYLNSTGKKAIPTSFLDDLLKVKFDLPQKFDALRFVPIGIPNTETDQRYINPISVSSTVWEEMLIVSPFVDKSTLKKICESTKQTPTLLSRKEELDGVDEIILGLLDCWQFSTYFQEAEYYKELEDAGMEPVAQNLHAKLFVAMKDRVSHWYLGSANCSDPAQSRNVEFMVELKANNLAGFKTNDIKEALTDPAKSDGITLFTPYQFDARDSVEEQKSIDLAIRKIKYDLTQLPIKGTAEVIDGGTAYRLSIDIDATKLTLPIGYLVNVKPLPEQQKAGVAIITKCKNVIESFSGYPETALSIFLVFEIVLEGTVYSQFLLPMEIVLPEGRLNKILISIIDSKEKFLKYLTFLLTGEETSLIANTIGLKNNGAIKGNDAWAFAGTPVFEKLLIASSRFPEKLKSIDELIKRLISESADLKEPIITEEFESFWNVFQTFISKRKR